MEITIQNKSKKKRKVHPQMFALWCGMASIFMLFAALTSAYIVRQAAGLWLEFPLPNMFMISTSVLVLSSIVLHSSFIAYKRSNELMHKLLLGIGLLLGIAFCVLQYFGWIALYNMGVPLDINPAASFVYVISAFHLLHILGGISALIIATIVTFVKPFKVTDKKTLRFGMTLHYWHFVDILWVYLFLFLTFYN